MINDFTNQKPFVVLFLNFTYNLTMKKKYLFLLLFYCSITFGNELTLYFFPSPYKMDWGSPQRLAKSVLKNTFMPTKYLLRHSIGHVSTELNCENDGYYHLSGMTTKDKTEDRDLLLKKKIGLGVVFYPMKGMLQSQKEVKDDLEDRYKKGRMNWLTFKISKPTCNRLKTYIQAYEREGIADVYGLVFNPRKKEGAGCSAFGVSMLEVAGLMTSEYRTEFSQRVFVNNDLDGFSNGEKKVSFFKVLAGLKGSIKWVSDKFTGRELFFWRPNLMYEWAQNKIKKVNNRKLNDYKIITRGKTKGLLIDRSKTPTPNEPIFY